MEKTERTQFSLSRIVGTLSAIVCFAQATEGYTESPSSTQSQQPCQASWYQCIKQNQLNPKQGYVAKVFDQYVAGRKVVISLEDLFAGKQKPTAEQICDAGTGRLYDLMASEAERKDTTVRAYFVKEARSLCPKTKLPNKHYPWMQYYRKQSVTAPRQA